MGKKIFMLLVLAAAVLVMPGETAAASSFTFNTSYNGHMSLNEILEIRTDIKSAIDSFKYCTVFVREQQAWQGFTDGRQIDLVLSNSCLRAYIMGSGGLNLATKGRDNLRVYSFYVNKNEEHGICFKECYGDFHCYSYGMVGYNIDPTLDYYSGAGVIDYISTGDIYDYYKDTLLFPAAPSENWVTTPEVVPEVPVEQPTVTIITGMTAEVLTENLVRELLGILPVVIAAVVFCLALRKGLRMLLMLLRQG